MPTEQEIAPVILYRVSATWVAGDGYEGGFDYGIFSTFALAAQTLLDVVEEDERSLAEKYRKFRRVDINETSAEIHDSLYAYRCISIKEYVLDEVRDDMYTDDIPSKKRW